MLHIPSLYIAPSENRGRGMFSAKDITIDDVIEICPVIPIPKEEVKTIDKTILYNYYFLWEENSACIALGYGSIYNHHSKPNAEIIADFNNQTLMVKCIATIKAGEEIFINYQGTAINKPKLWFTPTE